MTRYLLALALLVWSGPARADESFTGKDGIVWKVHREPGASNGQSESAILHVARGDREVGKFVESGAFQTNPTMMMSTTYAFQLDATRELAVTQTQVVAKRTGSAESRTTTTTIFTWNGAAFVAGKPSVTKT